MKLIINAGGNLGGGPLQMSIATINELINFPKHEYHIFLGPKIIPQIDKSKFAINYIFYEIPAMPFYKFNGYFSQLEKIIQPEVVFSLYGPSYWRPTKIHIEPYAHGYYIYKESPYLKSLTGFAKFKMLVNKLIHVSYYRYEADAFICETDDVNSRARKLIGKNKDYYTVSNTCGEQYIEPSYRGRCKKLSERTAHEFRLLTLAKYYPHKNIDIIKNVVDELRDRGIEDVKFVLTIDPFYYERLFGDNYLKNVITVGSVDVGDAPSLYEECDAMFLPTLVECFSASYPESMAMRRPILTSDLDFAHSICQDAALFFDPMNAKDITNNIIKLMNDRMLYNSLVEQGCRRLLVFPTVNQRTEKYLDICLSHSSKNNA